MKYMLTGGNGLLAKTLTSLLSRANDVYAPNKEALNIIDGSQVLRKIGEICPNVIIHCAAMTNVDDCERYPHEAFRTNALGTRHVAIGAKQVGATLVYISTDFVFNGKKSDPYHEFDEVSPISQYGVSKAKGESEVRTFVKNHFIVRTSWLYGCNGKNFISKLPKLLSQDKDLTIVSEGVGSPTSVKDLSRAILELLKSDLYGTYHLANRGVLSWMEIAKFCKETLSSQSKLSTTSFSDLGLPAKRPAYSPLTTLLKGPKMKTAKEALSEFLAEMKPILGG